MTFYLRYRPQTLADLDSADVRESLLKIFSAKSYPHAFLFSGPKGTGKTSAARIVAKILNCESASKKERGPKLIEPCNKCAMCTSITNGSNIDVLELDAASHRGIDDIRILREAVKLSPAKAKFKVYIIDEAHMLTPEASNALLKTLEEPPGHVVFMLATTNPEKLIGTIRSRTTNINFKKAGKEEIIGRLTKIAKTEKIKADAEALKKIAERSGGSFRDAVKILEQLVNENISIDSKNVDKYLSLISGEKIQEFVHLLEERNEKDAVNFIEELATSGAPFRNFLQSLLADFHSSLLAKSGAGKEVVGNFSKQEIIELIELFSSASKEIPYSLIEQIPIEIAVIKWCGETEDKDRKWDAKSGNINLNENEGVGRLQKHKEQSKGNDMSNSSHTDEVKFKDGNGITDEIWKKILEGVKPQNTSTEALLRASKPLGLNGNNLMLGVYYSFHKERLEEMNHRVLLEKTVSKIMGLDIRVSCVLTKPPLKKLNKETKVLPDGGEMEDNNHEEEYQPEKTESLTPGSLSDKSNTLLTETEDEGIVKIAKDIFGS